MLWGIVPEFSAQNQYTYIHMYLHHNKAQSCSASGCILKKVCWLAPIQIYMDTVWRTYRDVQYLLYNRRPTPIISTQQFPVSIVRALTQKLGLKSSHPMPTRIQVPFWPRAKLTSDQWWAMPYSNMLVSSRINFYKGSVYSSLFELYDRVTIRNRWV